MEAQQNLLSGFYVKTPLNQIRTSSIIPSISLCKSSITYTNWVSPKNLKLNFTRQQQQQQQQQQVQVMCKNSIQKGICDEGDMKSEVKRKKLAVFVSGGGSNFKSVHQACVQGSVFGDVVVLVTNKSGCGGAEYAASKEIPVLLFPKGKDEPNGLSPTDLVTSLREHEVDFILLAGYLKLIPGELVKAYPKSIVNIHPALLPAFGGKGYYGMKVHKAVIASGARYSGPTIHFVDENYDEGRILAQRVVPVLASDSAEDLAARVLHEEHKLYVEVAAALCEDRILWREDGVPLIQSKQNPDEYT
ncbi:hypothetical protein ACFE04_003559 [Oxalis oulophora]